MNQWTFRIAAICLWPDGLVSAGRALESPSVFQVVFAVTSGLWGFAVWRRHRLAAKLLVAALLAIGALVPLALIHPFHAIDAKEAVVAAPGFVGRTIAGAVGVAAIAFTGAIFLAYALKDPRRQPSGSVARPDALHSWRTVAILLGVGWLILLVVQTTAFLYAVEGTKTARLLRQRPRDTPAEAPSRTAGRDDIQRLEKEVP